MSDGQEPRWDERQPAQPSAMHVASLISVDCTCLLGLACQVAKFALVWGFRMPSHARPRQHQRYDALCCGGGGGWKIIRVPAARVNGSSGSLIVKSCFVLPRDHTHRFFVASLSLSPRISACARPALQAPTNQGVRLIKMYCSIVMNQMCTSRRQSTGTKRVRRRKGGRKKGREECFSRRAALDQVTSTGAAHARVEH